MLDLPHRILNNLTMLSENSGNQHYKVSPALSKLRKTQSKSGGSYTYLDICLLNVKCEFSAARLGQGRQNCSNNLSFRLTKLCGIYYCEDRF